MRSFHKHPVLRRRIKVLDALDGTVVAAGADRGAGETNADPIGPGCELDGTEVGYDSLHFLGVGGVVAFDEDGIVDVQIVRHFWVCLSVDVDK